MRAGQVRVWLLTKKEEDMLIFLIHTVTPSSLYTIK